jgi:hypothetical protein
MPGHVGVAVRLEPRGLHLTVLVPVPAACGVRKTRESGIGPFPVWPGYASPSGSVGGREDAGAVEATSYLQYRRFTGSPILNGQLGPARLKVGGP